MVPAISPNAAAGTEQVSVAEAQQIFDDVCVSQAPSFSGTASEAARIGFFQRSASGSYIHPRANVRIRREGTTCVMVFSSNGDQRALERALTSLGTPSTPVDYQALVMPPGLDLGAGGLLQTVSVSAR
jgi:hypothetical protein